MKAYVNKIINSTFIDGPGSRMAIFLQGCNFKCLYCHNPETQNMCTLCGKCVKECPKNALSIKDGRIVWDKDLCIKCDHCLKVCDRFSSPKYTEMDVDSVYKKIKSVEDFLDGITVSGGECTFQSEFLYELFKKIKENTSLTTFADTNGSVDESNLKKLCTVTDGFMFDLKCFDEAKHLSLTGVSNKPVFRNMEKVSKEGSLYEVRTVLVEGFTDSEAEVRNISEYIKNLNDYTNLKLIHFRPIGVKTKLNMLKPFDNDRYDELYDIAFKILGKRAIKEKNMFK